MSTTADVKVALKEILSDGKGRTHGELWKELISIEKLKGQLVKVDGTERKGVLSGIFTRVQNDKEEGFRIVKKDGKTLMVYSINKADTLLKLTDSYLKDVSLVKFKSDELSNTDKKVLEKFQSACNELSKIKVELKSLVDNFDKNGTKDEAKTEIVEEDKKVTVDTEPKMVNKVKDEPEEEKRTVTQKSAVKKVAESKDKTEPMKTTVKTKSAEKDSKQATKK
ncbi:hypothetical protein K5E_11080 [Enterococcus thailandicus]|uniref:hypothetical protein n=1 Tax=Enterococcus thailandicus TaxID=417368 RepID=UPI00244D9019|nr:hypothetical protein [Enterococcus thailandicus]GMC02594.1 hypothetical protein K4E_01040 [Enterococcus thailandicus]GMC08969.1 hypothetical protein K5E_11080 [Enterococcus thailandicus]